MLATSPRPVPGVTSSSGWIVDGADDVDVRDVLGGPDTLRREVADASEAPVGERPRDAEMKRLARLLEVVDLRFMAGNMADGFAESSGDLGPAPRMSSRVCCARGQSV